MPFADPSPVAYDQTQNTSGQPCAGYTLAAPNPAAGPPNTTSNPFDLALTPVGCVTALTLVITPFATDMLGNRLATQPTFTPATVTLTQANPTGSFRLNSAYSGKMLISCTHTESNSSGTTPPASS